MNPHPKYQVKELIWMAEPKLKIVKAEKHRQVRTDPQIVGRLRDRYPIRFERAHYEVKRLRENAERIDDTFKEQGMRELIRSLNHALRHLDAAAEVLHNLGWEVPDWYAETDDD